MNVTLERIYTLLLLFKHGVLASQKIYHIGRAIFETIPRWYEFKLTINSVGV